MDGYSHSDKDSEGCLVVVTGSPGAGKSALLGVLVCAAHPQLRHATQDVWRTAAARPSENPALAAVHARQRSMAEITASLGRQLLGSDGALDPGPGFYPSSEVLSAARAPQIS
jgi:energy-coupling factor transporter ATP-binding protein EcfA2